MQSAVVKSKSFQLNCQQVREGKELKTLIQMNNITVKTLIIWTFSLSPNLFLQLFIIWQDEHMFTDLMSITFLVTFFTEVLQCMMYDH
jgi:hypothetical protein